MTTIRQILAEHVYTRIKNECGHSDIISNVDSANPYCMHYYISISKANNGYDQITFGITNITHKVTHDAKWWVFDTKVYDYADPKLEAILESIIANLKCSPP